MPNVLISSDIGSEWRTILGHPQLIECMDINCAFSLAHGSELRGSDVYLHIVKKKKKKLEMFSLNSVKVCALGWRLLDFFSSGFFYHIMKDKILCTLRQSQSTKNEMFCTQRQS